MTSDFTVHMDEYLPLREVVFNTLRQAISALAAVAAIRTAVRYIFFPAEAYMAVAALTGTDIYGSSVCEH